MVFGTQLVLPGDFYDGTARERKPNVELMRTYLSEMHRLKPVKNGLHQNAYKNLERPDLERPGDV